uniref:Uncharacterized protein n=1 Tax=Siphoviridae sp. ctomJ2 TaxID=2827593 RepID=A0A8S5LJV5_9CAUD|nr:MAG TPA: hypothetical protein [Siphoviridae sp. ctomJ2]
MHTFNSVLDRQPKRAYLYFIFIIWQKYLSHL